MKPEKFQTEDLPLTKIEIEKLSKITAQDVRTAIASANPELRSYLEADAI